MNKLQNNSDPKLKRKTAFKSSVALQDKSPKPSTNLLPVTIIYPNGLAKDYTRLKNHSVQVFNIKDAAIWHLQHSEKIPYTLALTVLDFLKKHLKHLCTQISESEQNKCGVASCNEAISKLEKSLPPESNNAPSIFLPISWINPEEQKATQPLRYALYKANETTTSSLEIVPDHCSIHIQYQLFQLLLSICKSKNSTHTYNPALALAHMLVIYLINQPSASFYLSEQSVYREEISLFLTAYLLLHTGSNNAVLSDILTHIGGYVPPSPEQVNEAMTTIISCHTNPLFYGLYGFTPSSNNCSPTLRRVPPIANLKSP